MSATQTATIELTEVPLTVLSPTVSSPRSEIPPQTGRVFDVAPSNALSKSSRVLITFLLIVGNFVQFISNFVTFAGGFKLSQQLGRDVGPGQANWMAASYPLTQSAFVLISGRLGAVYGHQRILLVGGGFLVVFSLINAFCSTYESFVSARALTGIGGGLLMPNAVAMLMIMVPPGRARNVTMAFFAASPPIGGWCGAILAGIFVELTDWKWLFIFLALFGAAVFGGLFLAFPKEQPVDKGGKIDYIGAALGLSSLLLFNFAWNQAPSVGWNTPYEIAIVILSVVLFGIFLVWEKKFAKEPIMPLKIFSAPTFTALVFVVLLTYMSFGISNWYMVAWQQLIRDWTVIQLALGWIPFALGAVAAVGLAAWLIPRLDAQYILAIGVAVALASNLLLATMPEQQIYWAQMFPAILLGSVCPDFVFVAAQVIASNSVGRREQGVAGSLIGTLNLYGVSLGLGFAGTIETEIVKDSKDEVPGYRAALYFGVALAAVALVMDFAFVRLPKDDREGWSIAADDDAPGVGTATGVEGGTAA